MPLWTILFKVSKFMVLTFCTSILFSFLFVMGTVLGSFWLARYIMYLCRASSIENTLYCERAAFLGMGIILCLVARTGYLFFIAPLERIIKSSCA
jgi:hypothetical protein